MHNKEWHTQFEEIDNQSEYKGMWIKSDFQNDIKMNNNIKYQGLGMIKHKDGSIYVG